MKTNNLCFTLIGALLASTLIALSCVAVMTYNQAKAVDSIHKPTLALIYTVCFKGECNEYIAETYYKPFLNSIEDCKSDAEELDNQGIVWHCGVPESYTESYIPEQTKE